MIERERDKPVIIQPDPKSYYATMIDVLDELRQADERIGQPITKIAIPTGSELAHLERFMETQLDLLPD